MISSMNRIFLYFFFYAIFLTKKFKNFETAHVPYAKTNYKKNLQHLGFNK